MQHEKPKVYQYPLLYTSTTKGSSYLPLFFYSFFFSILNLEQAVYAPTDGIPIGLCILFRK